MRTLTFTALVMAMLLAGCGDSEIDSLRQARDDGQSCAALFEIRNGWESDSPATPEANALLQEIGCFSATSERTDQ